MNYYHSSAKYYIYSHFNTLKKALGKHCEKKLKLLKMSNFIFFRNVFYAICILASFKSNISVVVCSFFEFGTISKWCIRECTNGRVFESLLVNRREYSFYVSKSILYLSPKNVSSLFPSKNMFCLCPSKNIFCLCTPKHILFLAPMKTYSAYVPHESLFCLCTPKTYFASVPQNIFCLCPPKHPHK